MTSYAKETALHAQQTWRILDKLYILPLAPMNLKQVKSCIVYFFSF